MGGEEFLDMLSYVRTHPKDTTRLERRLAMAMAMYANANRGKDTPAIGPHEFCVDLLSAEEQEAVSKRERALSDRKDKAWRKQKMGHAYVASKNKEGNE